VARHRPRAVSPLDFSSVGRTGSRRVPGHSVVRRDYPSRGRNGYTSPTLRVRVPRHIARLVIDYFDYTARPGASTRCAARQVARRAAHRRLHRLCRTSGCLGTSRCSSLTSSPMLCDRVPRHVARLVVDYFAYVVHSGASARCAARRRPRAISPLDFSSVGRTGSRRASDHCVS
jgi:hypothetical protein